jgi:SsrA-binding protein
LNSRELSRLFGAAQREGYTIIPLSLYWKNNRAKLEIALAKGKKEYDKRETEKRRTWERQKQQLLKSR